MAKGASKSAGRMLKCPEVVGEYRRIGARAVSGGATSTGDSGQAAPLGRPRPTAGLVERPLLGNGHGGCGRRLGETHRWKHRQGAPGRPHRTDDSVRNCETRAMASRNGHSIAPALAPASPPSGTGSGGARSGPTTHSCHVRAIRVRNQRLARMLARMDRARGTLPSRRGARRTPHRPICSTARTSRAPAEPALAAASRCS